MKSFKNKRAREVGMTQYEIEANDYRTERGSAGCQTQLEVTTLPLRLHGSGATALGSVMLALKLTHDLDIHQLAPLVLK